MTKAQVSKLLESYATESAVAAERVGRLDQNIAAIDCFDNPLTIGCRVQSDESTENAPNGAKATFLGVEAPVNGTQYALVKTLGKHGYIQRVLLHSIFAQASYK
jgi:hypothetical protein